MLKRFCKSESGVAMVETAIVLPVLIIMLAGAVSLSFILYDYHACQAVLRMAARHMARVQAKGDLTNALATRVVADYLATYQDPITKEIIHIIVPKSSTVTVNTAVLDTANPRGGAVQLTGTFTFEAPLLKILFPSPTLTWTLSHREPYIGI